MNYYAEWWENARKQTGILTKPTYLKQLEKELAQLKANPDYQHLATELAQWKTKYEKVIKDRCLTEEENEVLKSSVMFWNAVSDSEDFNNFIDSSNEERVEKFINEVKNRLKFLEKVSIKIYPKLYTFYALKIFIIPNLLVVIGRNKTEINKMKSDVEKRLAEQKQEYESKLKTATNNQASILKTNLFQATENKELNRNISKLKEELSLLSSSETDQQRELQERGKLIIKLEEQQQDIKKELEFANSKVKQLSPLFNQVLSVIKKNVILRGKKELKEAIANIQELMEWEKSPLITEINTPTEPIKTAEQLALEEEYLHPDYKFDSPSYKFKETATEPSASDKKKLKKWRNISLNFTEELINQWESKGFSYERTADWINIGFTVKDADYAWWLEKGVGYDPLKYLNETSPEDQAGLKEQFEEYQQSKKK